MIIDSAAADKGLVGRRFVSNFLQLIRKYEYQQACPYTYHGRVEHANCFGEEKWNQPNWTQPNARNVTSMLINSPGVVAAGGWPLVDTTFAVSTATQPSALQYVINGGEVQTASFHQAGSDYATAPIKIPFGAIVDCGAVSLAAGSVNASTVVVDPAFDWNVESPTRRSSATLATMSITVNLKSPTQKGK